MKPKLLTAACVLAISFAGVTPCRASETPDPAAVVADVVVARPACLAATLVGTAFFVASLPIAAIAKSVRRTCNSLVVKPAQATFTRPVGDLDALLD